MKVDIKHLTEDESTYEFVLSTKDCQNLEEGMSFSSEGMRCQAAIKHIHNKFVLKGEYQVKLNCLCFSCLDEFKLQQEGSLDLILAPAGTEASSLSEQSGDGSFQVHLDDQDEDYFSGNELDLALYFENQLILDLPLRLLCSENCKGICSNCGNNLNKVGCSCEPDYSNSPFAALKDLKFD